MQTKYRGPGVSCSKLLVGCKVNSAFNPSFISVYAGSNFLDFYDDFVSHEITNC